MVNGAHSRASVVRLWQDLRCGADRPGVAGNRPRGGRGHDRNDVDAGRKQLWGEIRKAWKPILAGKLAPKAPDLYITPTNWALGLSVVDPVNMQGWHEGRVLVIADEAGGIEPPIFDAIQGLVAGGDSAILAIGNPIESSGPFFDLAPTPGGTASPSRPSTPRT